MYWPTKAKLVGCDGDFDTLLAKARFEEARLRDVVHRENQAQTSQQPPSFPISVPVGRRPPSLDRVTHKSSKSEQQCYNCNGTGHFACECLYDGRAHPLKLRENILLAEIQGTEKSVLFLCYRLNYVQQPDQDRQENGADVSRTVSQVMPQCNRTVYHLPHLVLHPLE